jgi:serine/threonine protein kinase
MITKLNYKEVWKCGGEIALAVAALHSVGIIHGDIKPSLSY